MPGTPWLSPRALAGWRREIGNAYPGFSSKYTVINYEQFQQPNRGSLVRRLVESGVDFVVLDEVQLVKQRDRNASIRREASEGLLSGLSEKNPNLYVFAMSATPGINNLLEARKLLEIIKGRSYRELEDAPTVNNALAVHRALMVEGFRYRPAYEMDEQVIEVDGNHLFDALMASRGVLSMEQMFLTAKLEAIEPYLRAGTMIYTHYVKGMIWPIRRYLEAMDYTVGIYTGEDKSGLEPFLGSRVDVLVGSKPVGTGLDGLQRVSNNLIILSPPGLLQKTRGSGIGSGDRAAPSAVSRSSSPKWSSATKVRTGLGTGAGGIRSTSSGRSLTVRSKDASLRPLGSLRPSSSGSPRKPLRSGSSGWGARDL